VASLSQGRTAAAQCGLFTHKSVPVIFEPPCTFHPTTAVTNPTLYSTENRPSSPTATSHAHVVIRYLYPIPFPHPHLTPKYTHLHPTATNIPFYGSIFCVLKWYYAICFMFHLT